MARNDDDLKARIVAIRKTIRPLKAGSEHETWPEALSRFQQFVSGDIDAFIDEDSGELTIINLAQETGTPGYICESAESAERMKHYAAEYDFPLPTELIELMCGHGCFKMPVGNSREYASLFTTWKNSGDVNLRLGWSLKTLQDTLKWNFGAFPDDLFSADQLQYFSQNLLFWGYFSSEDDGNYTYMFVDRAGRYGLFQYNEGDWPATRRLSIEPITRGMDERYSLDQLISKLVDSVIVRICQRHDLPMLVDIQVDVAFASFNEVAHRYRLGVQSESRPKAPARRVESVSRDDATLRLVWDGEEQHLSLEISHGPPSGPQAGWLQLFTATLPDGEFAPANETNDELLDAIEHGFELMTPGKPDRLHH